MNVRRVRADEWRLVRDLRITAIRELPLSYAERLVEVEGRPDHRWRDRVEQQASSPTDVLFVAEGADGGLVGMSAGLLDAHRDDVDPVFRLHYSYVVPAWRGRGLTRQLTAALSAAAAGLPEVRHVVVVVHEDNTAALATYLALGFVDTGQRLAHPVHRQVRERLLERALPERG